MEIGATSSSYLPPQFAEPRVRTTPEASNPQVSAVLSDRNRNENVNQSAAFPVSSSGLKAAEPRNATESQTANNVRTARENQQAAQARDAQRAQQQEVNVDVAGSIKLEVDDGNRVLKVFDSKDILIYQLPPKGALMLIKAQESAQQPQVQTSA